MLFIQQLSIAPKGQKSLYQGIDFQLEAGNVMAVCGLNGSGKTTLLRTISGHLKAVGGSVTWNGEALAGMDNSEKAKILSIVTTERPHIDYFSVLDIVSAGRYPHQRFGAKPLPQDEALVREAIELCGLTGFEAKDSNTLSDGEFQRVMLARALAQDTPLILMDEPTAHLDFRARIEIFELIKKLAKSQQKTILIATHELNLALKYADSCLVLEKHNGWEWGRSALEKMIDA